MKRFLAFVVLVAGCAHSPGAPGGCYRDHVVVYSDGSGKITVTIREKRDKALRLAQEIVRDARGVVAFTRPIVTGDSMTLTAYFDDINAVDYMERRHSRSPNRTDESTRFSFRRDGDEHVLEIDDQLFKGGEPKNAADERIERRVTMPGTIVSAEGYQTTSGRGAVYRWDETSIRTVDDAKRMPRTARRRIVCGSSEVSAAELERFRNELQDAKAAWPAIREELAKN